VIRTASLSLLLIATPATAGVVDTPQCRQDLARAGQLISAIRDRERQFQRGNIPLACRLWRQNVTEMSRARDLMFPCLSVHPESY
jgi:hypothetical protein